MRCFYVLILLIIVSIGCSSMSGRKSVQGNRNLILAEEIERSEGRLYTAHDVIRVLRPNLLDYSVMTNISIRLTEDRNLAPIEDSVFLDGVYLGNAESLTYVPTESIVKIQYLRPLEAASRYGLFTKGGGAFEITTK